MGRSLWTADSARRMRMRQNISRYEGQRLDNLSPYAYASAKALQTDGPEAEQIRWNLCRSLTDTVNAKIAGTQQPKIQFVASNADWSTRRKGPKLDAFVTGLWGCRQEPYADIWELGAAVMRDALICGMGALKVWSDTDAGQVLHERIFPWELLVDPADAKYGRPSHLFHVTTEPKTKLAAYFPECADALKSAAVGDTDDDTGISTATTLELGRSVVDLVRVYEWWSLPFGPDSPGKHVLAFDGGILIEEEWTRDAFPFGILRWSREFQGWHGRSLIDEIAPIDSEMNDIVARVVRTVRLTGMSTCFVHEDDKTTSVSNEDATVVRWSGPTPPTYVNAEPISPTHMSLIEVLKGAAYEFSGVNQMTATAQKQPGIESGAAIRMVADLQSERFSVIWRSYQLLFVEIARHDIACVRELAEQDPKFAIKWPGSGFLQSIPWSTVDLEDDLYVIQLASAPSIKGTPADRLQTAQDLFAAGQLSPDALLAVRTYLDLPGELDRVSRQRNVIERYIEQWLDATPEQIDSGHLEDGRMLVPPPIPWMKLEDALLQVVDAYMQAELDCAPDAIMDLFLRWISACNTEITKRQQRLAAMQAPPPGLGMPPGAPGAPAMPPPPQGAIAA